MTIKLRQIIGLLIFLTLGLKLTAQDKTIDSLKIALKNAKHDTTKIILLSKICDASDIQNILPYATTCKEICQKGLINSSINTKPFYLSFLADALNNIGLLNEQHGDIKLALENYNNSLTTRAKVNMVSSYARTNKVGTAITLLNIGNIKQHLGNMAEALELYFKSLKIQEEIQDMEGIAYTLNNIGVIYNSLGDNVKALEFHSKSLKIREAINHQYGIALSLSNIGLIYAGQGNISKAMEYYNKSLKIKYEIGDKHGIAHSLNQIGSMYKKKGDMPNALKLFNQALKVSEDIKFIKGIGNSLNNIGNVKFLQNKINESMDYALRSMKIANSLGDVNNIKSAAFLLKKLYKRKENFKRALEMYELEIQMRDSISNTETKKASIRKQFQYQYEKKAAADSVKNAEEQKVKNAQLTAQQAQLKQEKTQRFALYGGLLLVVAFSGFVFNRFKITQRQKIIIENQKGLVDQAYDQLHEKNKEVMDSIQYAARIQRSLITSEKYIDKELTRLTRTKKI